MATLRGMQFCRCCHDKIQGTGIPYTSEYTYITIKREKQKSFELIGSDENQKNEILEILEAFPESILAILNEY